MGLLQAPLLPPPHSKWVMLTLLLPVPLHIFLVTAPRLEDADHPHSGSQPLRGPTRQEQDQPLCHRPCLWFCGSGMAVRLPGQLGALSMQTSFRMQSWFQQVKKQVSVEHLEVQPARVPMDCSLFPFGSQSHPLNLHLVRGYCVSMLMLHQMGPNPVLPLRQQISQCSGLCLLLPRHPCGIQHGSLDHSGTETLTDLLYKRDSAYSWEFQELSRQNLGFGIIWTASYSQGHSFINSLLNTYYVLGLMLGGDTLTNKKWTLFSRGLPGRGR